MEKVSDLYRRLTYLLVLSTFFLMILGGYVKAINAGLSCPDWPLCYGKIFPFFDGNVYPYTPWQIFVEWFHRLFASLVGILMLTVVYKSRDYSETIPTLPYLGYILFILFGAQVLFGGLTVLRELNELIVVAHLGTAILILMVEMIMAFLAIHHSVLQK